MMADKVSLAVWKFAFLPLMRRGTRRVRCLRPTTPFLQRSRPLPKSLEDKLDKEDKFIISIWQLSPSCEKQKYTVIIILYN